VTQHLLNAWPEMMGGLMGYGLHELHHKVFHVLTHAVAHVHRRVTR
jgi:hypothetical protein